MGGRGDLVRVADLGVWIERPFELQGALVEIAAFFATVHAAALLAKTACCPTKDRGQGKEGPAVAICATLRAPRC